MKRPDAPAAPARPAASTSASRFWAGLAVASLLANIALLLLVLRAHDRKAAAAPAAAPAAVAATAGAGKPAGELGAYAALGSFVAENNRIPDLHWTEAQFAAFENGLRASYEGRGYALDDDAKKLRDDISARVQKLLAADRPDPVEEYFANLREKEHVLRTPSGLHYRLTDVGTGAKPTATSTVLISYSARLPSGESLPSLSRVRVRTAVSDLLPGLREGVQLLRVGGKGLIYVPAALSFGDGDWPSGVPKGAPIIFFLELHDVQ